MSARQAAQAWESETVLFIIDVDNEMNSCASGKHADRSRLNALKDFIRSFMDAKELMSEFHRFRVAVLSDSVHLLTRCGPSPYCVDDLRSITASHSYPACSLEWLPALCHQVQEEEARVGNSLRVILIYGRSRCMPTLPQSPSSADPKIAIDLMCADPKIAIDLMYLHEVVPEGAVNSKVQGIYQALVRMVDTLAPPYFRPMISEHPDAGMVRAILRRLFQLLSHGKQRKLLPQASRTTMAMEVVDVLAKGELPINLPPPSAAGHPAAAAPAVSAWGS